MDMQILTVSQLNMYVKGMLESDPQLSTLYLSGEISNFTNHYKSGHFYLTLKDDRAAIKAVMFRSSAQRIRFAPENGMKVICRGRVSLYERDGSYQYYIEDMQPDGIGALQVAYEQLKRKLDEAGLFDDSEKRRIPRYPNRVAVITSPTGAAVQDIINVITRRCPLVELKMFPVLVQGEQAALSLTKAVEQVNELDCADVIIIGRGGGSLEDLWAFNSEQLAYAIYGSHIPVISAVGHETDYTICDFVADLRAPTPSAAAELAVPDSAELKATLTHYSSVLTAACSAVISRCASRLELSASKRVLSSPESYLNNLSERVDNDEKKLVAAMISRKTELDGSFAVLAAKLDALSPLKTIARGYAVACGNDRVIRTVAEAQPGDKISVRLRDGALNCTVNNIVTE